MKKNLLKVFSAAMVLSMLCGMVSGCDNAEKTGGSGQVEVKVGGWPTDASQNELKLANAQKEEFERQNPDIKIIPDTYAYSADTFMVKASANQLPDMYVTYFTETQKIINQGFAEDITPVLEELNWKQYINADIVPLLEDKDGKLYGVPADAYAQGIAINKELFKQAGLTDEKGYAKIPKTWDEVVEFAKIIKEKTGKAGFAIPTTANCGGWHFINIAWSFGTSFMEADASGKYKATFDTDETKSALQFIKDMKWKYGVLPDNTVIDNGELRKMFSTNQVGMIILNPPFTESTMQYGMPIESMASASMPEGPAGRYSQMGGNVFMFSKGCSADVIKAGLKWAEFQGKGPTISDDQLKALEDKNRITNEEGGVVMNRDAFNVWENEETIAKKEQAASKYCNIDPLDYEDYFKFEGVHIKPEEPVCCQELYATLDKCIQEVITNENADVSKVISDACKEFQANYLDKNQ